jgi:hypothetical protein
MTKPRKRVNAPRPLTNQQLECIMAKADITFARLRELLNYDADTGVFTWAVSRPGAAKGAPAGSRHSGGYVVVKIDRQRYFAHRLAWFWVTACWPRHDIDHRGGDRANNRLSNLRLSTRGFNLENQRAAKSHNKLGLLGVMERKMVNGSKFVAVIVVGGKRQWIGTYATPEKAHTAYVEAKRLLHPACTL